MAYLPIMKLRAVYPDLASILAALGLAMLILPLLIGRNRRIGGNLWAWWLLPGMLAVQLVMAIGYSAPLNAVAGNAAGIASAMIAAIVMYVKGYSVEQAIDTVLKALACLLIASTALYFLDVRTARPWDETPGFANILRSLGFYVWRSGMPLTGGAVSHSTLAAVVLAGMVVRARLSIFSITAVGCALWGLAIGDGRGAMIGGLAGVIGALVLGGWFRWSALSVPAGFSLLSAAALLPKSWLYAISRTGDATEIVTGNNRTLVWQQAFNYLADHPVNLLIGAGHFGQVTSGIVGGMAAMTKFENAAQLSLHNVGVQALFDGGMLGLALTTLWLFYACKGLEKFPIGAAMMLAMLVAGVFDVWASPYSDEGFFALAALGMIGISQTRRFKMTKRTQVVARQFRPAS